MGKNGLFLTILVCGLLSGCGNREGDVKSPHVKHVVVLGFDAMSPRGLEKAVTPNLNRMIAGGASCFEGRCILTPASTQNWTTMLTGAIPVQHGVTDNSWQRDNRRILPAITGVEDVFPSVFEWVRKQKPDSKIYFFHHWKNVDRMFARSVMDSCEHVKPGEEAFRRAMEAFFADKPDLLFLHILDMDNVGHSRGHDTEAYYRTIEKYDSLIGEFMDRLERAKLLEETLVLVVADHGGFLGTHSGESAEAIEIPIILYGKGVARGKSIPHYFIYDVAPTIAWALGVTPPDLCVGKPLKAAFTESDDSFIYSPMPRLTPDGGLYDTAITVSMHADWPEGEIFYTLDGSEPTEHSIRYTAPIMLDNNCILKAVTFRDGHYSHPAKAHYRFKGQAVPKVSFAYYEDDHSLFVPDFKGMIPTVTGKCHEISLDEIPHRPERFSVYYDAMIEIPTTGEYRFHTRSDDGCWLKIDGKTVSKSATAHFQETYCDVSLDAGLHKIEIGYRQDVKRRHLSLLMAGPGVETEEEILTNKFFR